MQEVWRCPSVQALFLRPSLFSDLFQRPVAPCPCSPEAMMQEVWRYPSAQALADLKECLDFGASAWIALFARLGGADLLLQVHQTFATATNV